MPYTNSLIYRMVVNFAELLEMNVNNVQICWNWYKTCMEFNDVSINFNKINHTTVTNLQFKYHILYRLY